MRHVLVSLTLAAATLLACGGAQAQAADAEKQKVIDRLLLVWHPENPFLAMVQRPGVEALQQARAALQGRVSAEKMDKTLKDMNVDAQKYIDTVTPIATASAKKNVGPAVTSVLAQNFTLDELKQILAMYESPLKAKFEKFVPQIEQAVGQKMQADSGAAIDAQVKELTKNVGTKLRLAATAP